MRKALIILAAAGVTQVGATEPYVWLARYDWTAGEPALLQSGEQLKSVWRNATPLTGNEIMLIVSDNGNYFEKGPGNATWAWIMVRIAVDHNDHGHIIRWEGYTDSYDDYGMECYVWDAEEENFDYMDAGPEGIWTESRTFPLKKAYFTWEPNVPPNGAYVCLILVQGYTLPYERGIHIDVVNGECP